MKYMNLGDTGLSVSRLCLGMMTYGSTQWHNWILEYDESRPFVERALDAGINFFDTADVYSTSLGVGAPLGHYAVSAKLAEGGMGEVWEATDTKLNRQVALKILL